MATGSISTDKKNVECKSRYKEFWDEAYKGIHSYVITSYTNNKTDRDVPHKNYMHGESRAYWDNYFNTAGALIDDSEPAMFDMAKKDTENLLYIVDKMGYVPNAYNTSWGVNRSQPPVLSMMVRDIYERMSAKDKQWLTKADATVKKEYHFWTDMSPEALEDHSTGIEGLSKFYFHNTTKEEGEILLRELNSRLSLKGETEEENNEILRHYFSEAASGMDFTTRFEGRCADFAALDLNCNLYAYEINFAFFSEQLGTDETSLWLEKAAKRKELIQKYFWDSSRGLFLDYDFVNKRTSKIASVCSYIPLYLNIATKEQATASAKNLKLFECEWGLSNVEYSPEALKYQWGWPIGWGVGHFWAFIGLYNYDLLDDLERICTKWLDLCTKNFVSPEPPTHPQGRLHEKYDVENGTIIFREYASHSYLSFTLAPFNWAYRYLTTGKAHYWGKNSMSMED